MLTETFRQRTQAAWLEVFEGSDACVGPVVAYADAPDHPHLRSRGTFVERDGVVQPAPAPRFSRTEATISASRRAAPAPGPARPWRPGASTRPPCWRRARSPRPGSVSVMIESDRHVDVLIIGAGLSGIGAAAQLTREHPRPQLPRARVPRGQRRHLGPVPLPGHPLRLRHVHPRLPLQAVARREGAGRRPVDPRLRPRDRPRVRRRRAHRLRPPRRRGGLGQRRRPAGPSPRRPPTAT